MSFLKIPALSDISDSGCESIYLPLILDCVGLTVPALKQQRPWTSRSTAPPSPPSPSWRSQSRSSEPSCAEMPPHRRCSSSSSPISCPISPTWIRSMRVRTTSSGKRQPRPVLELLEPCNMPFQPRAAFHASHAAWGRPNRLQATNYRPYWVLCAEMAATDGSAASKREMRMVDL